MKKYRTTVLEVNIEGKKHHLTLMNGSSWFVNPEHLSIVATWIPKENIEVEGIEDGTTFSYQLVNLDDDVSIRAMKVK